MLKLKKIQSDASWGKVVDDINGNNGAIVTAVEMSKFANVDWGEEVAFPIVNAISSSATLQHNTCYLFGEVEDLNITLDSDDTPLVKVYMFQFHSGATPTRLSVPSSVEWANDPVIKANRVYQVTIIDGYATYREFLFNTADIPTTEIWYTSLDGNVVEPYSKTVFGATYESSTYEKGKGIMTFAGEVTKIGASAFDGNTQLTSVTPPSSVKEIGNNAFKGCAALTKVHIPDGVTSIGGYAFQKCSSLTSVSIPDSVITLGSFVFYQSEKIENVIIGNSVTEIRDGAFYYCSSLKNVTIGKSVTSIGQSAFRRTLLENVILPEGLTTIGHHAFQTCTSLISVTLPSSLESVDYNAFENTRITEITIPASLVKIGDYAFYTSTLVKVTFESTTPPTLGTNAFRDVASLKMYVPLSAEDAYKTAYPGYASKIVGYQE